MKKLLSILSCLATMLIFCTTNATPKLKKIVILTSKGGNGHMATCAALKDILPDYNIVLSDPMNDFFHKSFDYGDLYGNLLKNGYIRTLNFGTRHIGQSFFKIKRRWFKKRLIKFFKQEQPDLVISVIPLLNYSAYQAAQQCKIPFMNITLDADLTLWLLDMKRCKTHDFLITVNAKTPHIKKQLARKHIPDTCIREVGAPLRKEFFEPKDIPAIKKEWNIPEHKKVILLMRGSTGSDTLVDYVETLIKLNKPVHLLVCIGRNTKLIKELKHIKNTGSVTFSVIPFTKKIPDLMAVSDLLIAQPSPNVCNEAIHMKLPILVDMTGPCLFWEKPTIDWIHMFGYGAIFKRMRKLNKLVLASLNKKQELMAQKPRQSPCFNTNIRTIITSLILPQAPKPSSVYQPQDA